MKKLIYILSLTALSSIMVSCTNQGMKIATREDEGSYLADYDTYAWMADVENIPYIYAF